MMSSTGAWWKAKLREGITVGVIAGLACALAFCGMATLGAIIERDNLVHPDRDLGRRFFHDLRAQRLWDDRMARNDARLRGS